MGIIRELPREVAEKIAAGEVVERPASVVKELVENALDAGASSVVIDVADGGKKSITIIDDGSGMDAEDLKLSVLRHATSKISSEEDLWSVRTMGFRGEALSAIGAVSKLSIETRLNRPDIIEGARIEVAGSAIHGPIAVGSPGGTKISVQDLFFNVPARQKFLRSGGVEFGHISEVVTSLSLAFPSVKFELFSDGRKRYFAGQGELKDRVVSVIGEKFRDKIIEINDGAGEIAVTGWVADGGRSGGKDMYLFLNRRLVRDKILMHAVSHAFGETLMRGEYPAAAIWIEMDPSKVDVNVHPQKREVRFANSSAVHDFIVAAVRKALSNRGLTPILGSVPGRFNDFRHETRDTRHESCEGRQVNVAEAINRFEEGRLARQSEFRMPSAVCEVVNRPGTDPKIGVSPLLRMSHDPSTSLRAGACRMTELRPIGQLGLTYIVCEDADGTLVLIDQHAAHERLGFDALKKNYSEGSVPQQRLLIPERVELGAKALAYVSEHLELLHKTGFEIEPFGGDTILVKATPAIMGSVSTSKIFDELAKELEDSGSAASIEEELDRIFAVVACHRQVRAGDKLSAEELLHLIGDIERENVTHCPHGRPVSVKIEKAEIEKWFKRS